MYFFWGTLSEGWVWGAGFGSLRTNACRGSLGNVGCFGVSWGVWRWEFQFPCLTSELGPQGRVESYYIFFPTYFSPIAWNKVFNQTLLQISPSNCPRTVLARAMFEKMLLMFFEVCLMRDELGANLEKIFPKVSVLWYLLLLWFKSNTLNTWVAWQLLSAWRRENSSLALKMKRKLNMENPSSVVTWVLNLLW